MSSKFQEREEQLSEIYGNKKVFEFSLLNNNKPVHPFFRCKDFYNDIIYTLHTKNIINIYNYSTENILNNLDILDKKEAIMYIRYRNNESLIEEKPFENIKIIRKFINTILKYYNLPLIKIKKDKNYIVLTFPIFYLKFSPFLSLLLYIVRLFLKNSITGQLDDIISLKSIKPITSFKRAEEIFNGKYFNDLPKFNIKELINLPNIYPLNMSFFEKDFNINDVSKQFIHDNGYKWLFLNHVKDKNVKEILNHSHYIEGRIDKNKNLNDVIKFVHKK
jgi:hypothetical protein